jgi:hypothetical protein
MMISYQTAQRSNKDRLQEREPGHQAYPEYDIADGLVTAEDR